MKSGGIGPKRMGRSCTYVEKRYHESRYGTIKVYGIEFAISSRFKACLLGLGIDNF